MEKEYSDHALPIVEGKCPPIHEMVIENGEWKHRWYYPEPDQDYEDPEMYETDKYYVADKEEYYNYLTVCKGCGTQFLAYGEDNEIIRKYCPGCGMKLEE